MNETHALTVMPHFRSFAGLVGRLRLTQGEVRRLLAADGADGGVVPGGGCDFQRLGSVVHALDEALELVGDDGLVVRWLRSPLPRRGGTSPLEEVEGVAGDLPIRFVLRPHPMELVRLIADGAAESTRAVARRNGHGRLADDA